MAGSAGDSIGSDGEAVRYSTSAVRRGGALARRPSRSKDGPDPGHPDAKDWLTLPGGE